MERVPEAEALSKNVKPVTWTEVYVKKVDNITGEHKYEAKLAARGGLVHTNVPTYAPVAQFSIICLV